ncbi:hypothetical protein GUITHDRAFT_138857 [Guillardia theta CCMP2712]|uniref:Right handed beta helix domain-containing protein n=1 Tax=Guillardia theta (strain CCMP2712) TaxID=905079 RepID=L1JC18_GUITC|nr:hypothetical protein GUITHDRAFT_138857 [Guillardia theta CCMP2712]EKX45640.1 hypothetical protein GUITHDRAFT_138857 [Guillardia theta CCMP2712]|eukprot:XP_005832620.1 hypothetical protein GUITHDRAFT_138857 [Guillardia theta CCMP2712]
MEDAKATMQRAERDSALAVDPSAGDRGWFVDCSGGSDHEACGWQEAPCGTIQHVLDRVQSGDHVYLKGGVCKGNGNVNLVAPKVQVAISSVGDNSVEIDCEGSTRGISFIQSGGFAISLRSLAFSRCIAEFGGAIFCENASPHLSRVVFKRNKATSGGGAIYWKQRGPVLDNCTFIDNDAPYGKDVASAVERLAVGNERVNYVYHSGDEFIPPLKAKMFDFYGQEIVSASGYVLRMQIVHFEPEDPTRPELRGQVETLVDRGEALWRGLQLFAQPGSVVSMAAVYSEQELQSDPIVVHVRQCHSGEPEVPCQKCPFGTRCPGGSQIIALQGFFITSKIPLQVEQCPYPKSCLGGENSYCAAGFTGELCRECQGGLSNCFGDCVEGLCWPLKLIITIMVAAAGVVVHYFLKWSSESDAQLMKKHSKRSKELDVLGKFKGKQSRQARKSKEQGQKGRAPSLHPQGSQRPLLKKHAKVTPDHSEPQGLRVPGEEKRVSFADQVQLDREGAQMAARVQSAERWDQYDPGFVIEEGERTSAGRSRTKQIGIEMASLGTAALNALGFNVPSESANVYSAVEQEQEEQDEDEEHDGDERVRESPILSSASSDSEDSSTAAGGRSAAFNLRAMMEIAQQDSD